MGLRVKKSENRSTFAEVMGNKVGGRFYPRDVVSGVFATATWLGGWLSVTAGIVSKRLNLS